jgi:hypothetical protein
MAALCALQVPSVAQRGMLYGALASLRRYLAAGNFQPSGATYPALLRTAFHDAGTYSPNETKMVGGANGCIRFEEGHGSAGNNGIAFTIGTAANLVSRYLTEGGLADTLPFSYADLFQFAGVVAVAEMGGPNATSRFRWGRADAPWLWCQGEIQLALPDFNGGQRRGS